MKAALVAVVILCGLNSAIAGGLSISPIVLVGDPAPGGCAISLIQTGFVRNSAGQLLFTGDELGSQPDGGSQGMWMFDQSGGRLIAQISLSPWEPASARAERPGELRSVSGCTADQWVGDGQFSPGERISSSP